MVILLFPHCSLFLDCFPIKINVRWKLNGSWYCNSWPVLKISVLVCMLSFFYFLELLNIFLFNWAIVYVPYLLLNKSLSLSLLGMQDFLMAWQVGGNHRCVSHYKYHFPVSQLRVLDYTCSGVPVHIHDQSLLESSSSSWLISCLFLCRGKCRSLY